MLERLRQKWKVGTVQLILILCVFAITGTTTAFISKAVTGWVGFDDSTPWVSKALLRLAVLLFGYQAILLAVAFIFGQFAFFWNYERKIFSRMKFWKRAPAAHTPSASAPTPIAVFASGAGSNAARLIEHFRQSPTARVALVVCNKAGAGVINIAATAGIPVLMIEKERFFHGDAYLPELRARGIRWLVLAGFLWKVPGSLVAAYPRRIVNIHPALLPHYGGKGMYGRHVHEAVIAAGEGQSGITIHYVDEHYDHGDTIFQQTCPVLPGDGPEDLAGRIHALEHRHFAPVVEAEIRKAAES